MEKLSLQSSRQAADTLDRAIALLHNEGWIQGQYVSYRGYCTLGAIRKANGPGCDRATYIVSNLIKDSIPNWNDHSSQTKENVIVTLTKARDIALEQGNG